MAKTKTTKMKKKSLTIRKLISLFSMLAAALIIFVGSSRPVNKSVANEADTVKGLKDFYKDYFPVGVAVAPNSLEGAPGGTDQKAF